jgi:hypothetical protein
MKINFGMKELNGCDAFMFVAVSLITISKAYENMAVI